MLERIGKLLPLLGLTAAAALVVVLSLKVRDLNEQNTRLTDRVRFPYAGMWVPTFRAATHTGDSVTVGEGAERARQVLFVFTTTCPYCQSTLPAWKQITAALDTVRSRPVAVYGVSLDSAQVTEKYVEHNQLPWPVLSFPEEKLSRIYRAGTVPLTLVLDDQGRVVHSRLGEISTQAAVDSVIRMVHWEPTPAPAPAQGAAR